VNSSTEKAAYERFKRAGKAFATSHKKRLASVSEKGIHPSSHELLRRVNEDKSNLFLEFFDAGSFAKLEVTECRKHIQKTIDSTVFSLLSRKDLLIKYSISPDVPTQVELDRVDGLIQRKVRVGLYQQNPDFLGDSSQLLYRCFASSDLEVTNECHTSVELAGSMLVSADAAKMLVESGPFSQEGMVSPLPTICANGSVPLQLTSNVAAMGGAVPMSPMSPQIMYGADTGVAPPQVPSVLPPASAPLPPASVPATTAGLPGQTPPGQTPPGTNGLVPPKPAKAKTDFEKAKQLMLKTAKDAGTLSEYHCRLAGLDICDSLADELEKMRATLMTHHDALRAVLAAAHEAGKPPDMAKVGIHSGELNCLRPKLLKLTDFAKHSLGGLLKEQKAPSIKPTKKAHKTAVPARAA